MSKKVFKIIKRLVIGLLALLVIGAGYGYYFVNKSLPTYRRKSRGEFFRK